MKNKFNIYAIILTAILVIVPIVYWGSSSEFTGTDEGANNMINSVSPDYKPWFDFIWEPSGEMATFLFSVQTAIGALIIGYFFGYFRGLKKKTA